MTLPRAAPTQRPTSPTDEAAWIEAVDGAALYTAALGTGPAVVFCNGLGVAADTFWPRICAPLSPWFRTIRWDYAGHGRSDPPADPASLTVDRCASDLARVLDHWGVGRAVVVGHSVGAQIALRFHRCMPERTAGLGSVLGTFERPLDTFLDSSRSAPVFAWLSGVAERHPALTEWLWPRLTHPGTSKRVARALRLVRAIPEDLFDEYLRHLRSMSPWVMLHLVRSTQAHSERAMLPSIDVPMLIVAAERDRFIPVAVSEEMHALVPGSRLRIVPGASHAALGEDPDAFVDALLDLLLAVEARGGGAAVLR